MDALDEREVGAVVRVFVNANLEGAVRGQPCLDPKDDRETYDRFARALRRDGFEIVRRS